MIEEKILVIDDEESQRVVMQRFIMKLGYAVTVVNSSEQALDILANEEFPLIITDLCMPEMDGIQLCRHIRETNPHSVIYALSGYIETFELEELEKIGFDGHLCKPATAHVLRQAIEGAFSKLKRVHSKKKTNGS